MKQPVKGEAPPKKKTKKKRKPTVHEIILKNIERSKKPHPDYGTSKLEDRFCKNILDKLGVKYERQFEAKDIKRFYDVYLPEYRVLIEIDGDYFHGYGKVHEEKSPMQKKNERVDEIKDKWAALHGIPLIRIWEHDINENPEKVLKMLRKELGIYEKKKKIEDDKKKRH